MHTEESSDDANANHIDSSGGSVVLCASFKDNIMREYTERMRKSTPGRLECSAGG